MGLTYVVLWVIASAFVTLVFATKCIHHVVKIKDPITQKRRVWVAVIFGYGALVSAAFALLPLIGMDRYYAYIMLGLGVLMLMISTIPCGIEFFNRRYIRSLRNIFFVVVGVALVLQNAFDTQLA